MKRRWELEELIECFTFLPNELQLLGNKTSETRLGFAVLFKFFQNEARFPNNKAEIPKIIIEYIGKQIGVNPNLFYQYDMDSRSYYYHKSQIREIFNFQESTVKEAEDIIQRLFDNVLQHDMEFEHIKDEAYKKFRELKMEPPISQRIERIINSILHDYEKQFFYETIKNYLLEL